MNNQYTTVQCSGSSTDLSKGSDSPTTQMVIYQRVRGRREVDGGIVGIQAWLVFLAAGPAFGLFLIGVLLGAFGPQQAAADRMAAISRGFGKGIGANKSLLVVAFGVMILLNASFGAWPVSMDLASGQVSGSEQGRVLASLGLYLLAVAAWFLALWKLVMEIRKELEVSDKKGPTPPEGTK